MEEDVLKNLGYHYTSIEAFMKMLEGIENGFFKFHASSIFSLNDPTEMEYGYKEIVSLFPILEEELGFNNVMYKLSCKWNMNELSFQKMLMKRHLEKMNENFQHACTISFSCNRDNLQLWRMYGNNGRGVALGFDIRTQYIRLTPNGERILDGAHIDFSIPHSLEVVYGIISTKSPLYLFLKREYIQYWKSIQGVADENEILDKQIGALTQMIMILAPFIKNQAYEYENESRIIQVHKSINDIKVKLNTKGGLIPYIEVEIPTSYLKEVLVGPCCDFDFIKKCIEIRLCQIGLEDVEITHSEVPYRS